MRYKTPLVLAGICTLAILAGCVQPNLSPIARFTRNPSSGEAPLFVTFDASSSEDPDGRIVQYSWNFGDGGTGSGVTASRTYNSAGNYTVTLTVRDDLGDTDSTTRTVYVTGAPTPPPPDVDYSVTAGQILDEFDANEVAATLKYQNKTIAVSGYVDGVSVSLSGEPYVTLERDTGFNLFWVFCYFPTAAMASLASLSEGDHITIIGEYDSCFAGSVWLEDCRLP